MNKNGFWHEDLEEAVRIGSIEEFIDAIKKYDAAMKNARLFLKSEDLSECKRKIYDLFNDISSIGRDDYWNY